MKPPLSVHYLDGFEGVQRVVVALLEMEVAHLQSVPVYYFRGILWMIAWQ